ncbi:X-ray repair cross-complementing protein 5 isoform X2 [Nematostella vectensis]|nr:X-ray repair cross-complementing protein 5 isoform X2 [Nematostella vectensis]
MDLLREKTRGKKCDKKIYLFTDLGSPFGNDQLDKIVDGLIELDAQFVLVGPDLFAAADDDAKEGDDAGEGTSDGRRDGNSRQDGHRKQKTAQQIAGEKCVQQLLEAVDGSTYSFSDALPILSFFETRAIKQTTVFRGPLEIGSSLKINVHGYNRVREEKLASWKKLSAIAQASPNSDSMEVTMERTYHRNDEDQTEIEKENVAQGYRYGKTIVPLTKIDKEGMKLETEKCLSVLGFSHKDNIKRHHYIGENVTAFTAQPEDEHASIALSAFINAMHRSDTVAIVRYCFRKNAAPKLGFLSPHIKEEYECLLFTAFPFAEDLRHFSFASLDGNKKLQPTEDQLRAIDDLITVMDLSKAQRDEYGEATEALKPKCTFNPTRQRVFQCIQHRALHPNDPSLPSLEPVIASYLEPSAEFLSVREPQCLRVKDYFPLEKVERKKAKESAAEIFKSNVDQHKLDEPAQKRAWLEPGDEVDFSMAGLAKGTVTEVGTVDPVSDFLTIIGRVGANRFNEAADQMKSRILQLVMDSFGDQLFAKALSCVTTLRNEAIKANKANMFNDFLRDLKSRILNQRGHAFWLLLTKERVTLINDAESGESVVSEAQAQEFLEKKGTVKEEKPVQEEELDDDDLLAMME